MNIIIVGSDKLRFQKLSVVLRNQGITFQQTDVKDIRRKQADVCIYIDSLEHTTDLRTLEGIIYEEITPIIYVNSKKSLVHNLEYSPLFSSLDERHLDILLLPVINMLTKAHREIGKLRKELELTKSRVEEERLVSKAKFKLIEESNISEDEAHRLIQEEAMKTRLPKSVIAKRLISK